MKPTLTRLITAAAPWIVPVPSAWWIFAGTTRYMLAPAWVGVFAALGIEFIGLSAVNLALRLREYNLHKRKTDPAAPELLAYVIMGGYVLVVIVLGVLLDPAPTLATAARAVFPLLSLAAFGVIAMEDDHAARLATIAADKADAKAARAQHKLDSAQAKQQASHDAVASVPDAQPVYKCGWGCDRAFSTIEGRSAHMRFCAKQNGHEPEHITQKEKA